jgi:hypothetical protein
MCKNLKTPSPYSPCKGTGYLSFMPKQGIDDQARANSLREELGFFVCFACLKSGDLKVSPSPERSVSTKNSQCVNCSGTGRGLAES